MNRFSVIYTLHNQYYQISCETHSKAEEILNKIFIDEGGTPIGIYDAKTELFFWEAERQQQYDQMNIEEQGRLGSQIIDIAQTLRLQEAQRSVPGLSREPIFSTLISSL